MASEYKDTSSHWESMQKLQLSGKEWRRYINVGEMDDVTDDLIEDFISGKSVVDIALEHAARRAEIYNNVKLSKKNQELRNKGIRCSGYNRSKLFVFKKDGEALIKNNETQSTKNTEAVDSTDQS